MKAVQAPYFEALNAVEGLKRARIVAQGYERNYRRGSLFVCVCPWHWRAYSHFQFWELFAAAHLAKLKAAKHAILVTNEQWTDWCWHGFDAAFDRVLVGSPGEVAAEVERALDDDLGPALAVPVPERGQIFFGQIKSGVTTMTLKASLDAGLAASGERVEKRAALAPSYGGARPVTFHHALRDGLVIDVKGFRNPDPIHEVKILAGKAFAVGPERARRILYVVDGRVRREDVEMIAAAGANVTTPDSFRVAVKAVAASLRTGGRTKGPENEAQQDTPPADA